MEGAKHKSLQTVLKSLDESKGIVEAYVSVFGIKDSYGDLMEFGCFADSIAKKMPVGVWMHRWDQPIAKTLEIREVPAGDASLPDSIKAFGALYVKGKISMDIERGKEALVLLRDGVIDEFSIGYFEREAADATVDGERCRFVKRVDLIEWSPVLRGANPLTSTVSVKGPRLPFAEHSDQTLGSLKEFHARATDLASKRAEKGERLQKEKVDDLREMHRLLGETIESITAPEESEVAKARALAALSML